MTSRAEQLREDARLRAMRLIDVNPDINQRQIARELVISLGATHYMLDSLVAAGLVKLRRFSASSKKRGYVYALTPQGISERAVITARFLARKRQEYDALRREIEELTAEVERSESSCGEQV